MTALLAALAYVAPLCAFVALALALWVLLGPTPAQREARRRNPRRQARRIR